ncbi:hypothetical protein BDN72DRAFT_965270 [Pluteus cervinus]|uniref:Uncharacterized protein n=1 Tax=Pluteus cervinus TaxID=181527 RepID=A0ACD3A8X8_9AGAR|nr:hypothetical protein BDN72DRAFT_965270 [Pluteus cervinus]
MDQPQAEYHPYDPHFEERFQIDEEILLLQNRLQTLKRTRNSLLPISTLPREILTEIFLLASTAHEDGLIASEWVPKMSWVCHSWRTLALDNPLLWTEIGEALSETWAKEFLKRSKSAAIYLEIYYRQEQDDLMASLPSQFHRIRYLKLVNADRQENLESVLTAPAPILYSLDLWGWQLPRQLFSGQSPFLHIIRLTSCRAFDFDNLVSLSSQLTEFHLDHPIPEPSLHQLLVGLGSFPHLQILTLTDTLGQSDLIYRDTGPPLPHIELLALRSFTIHGCPISPVSHLLCHIAVKQDLIAHIHVKEPTCDHLLPTALSLYEHFELFSLHVSRTFFHLTMSRSAPDHPTAMAQLSTGLMTPTGLCLLLSSMSTTFPSLRSVVLLQGHYDHGTPQISFWSDMLSPQPDLQVMKLGGVYAVSFIEYMASLQTPNSSGSSAQTHIPFRSLHTLTIQDVPVASWPGPLTCRSFFQAFKKRKEGGIGLEELVISLDYQLQGFDDIPLSSCAAVVHVAMQEH